MQTLIKLGNQYPLKYDCFLNPRKWVPKKINESTVANKDSPNKQVIFDAHTVKVHTQVVQPVNQYVN